MQENTHPLVREFPALAGVVDRIKMVNGVVKSADLLDDGDGAALYVVFEFNGHMVNHRLATFQLVQQLFEVTGKRSLAQLQGAAVRIESFSQASWCPFFRVWHFMGDENLLLRYEADRLERYARTGSTPAR